MVCPMGNRGHMSKLFLSTIIYVIVIVTWQQKYFAKQFFMCVMFLWMTVRYPTPPENTQIREWLRYCRKVCWTKITTNLVKMTLIPNWILAFARPKWSIPFWSIQVRQPYSGHSWQIKTICLNDLRKLFVHLLLIQGRRGNNLCKKTPNLVVRAAVLGVMVVFWGGWGHPRPENTTPVRSGSPRESVQRSTETWHWRTSPWQSLHWSCRRLANIRPYGVL